MVQKQIKHNKNAGLQIAATLFFIRCILFKPIICCCFKTTILLLLIF